MTGPKLNERPVLRRRPQSRPQPVDGEVRSARAVAKYLRVSPYKVREVLDLIRGHDAERAIEILRFCERDAAEVVSKALNSALANAEQNHSMLADEMYVSACYADEGPTLKRWRPRARGRATRIRKRTSHVTVIVSRLPESELQGRRSRQAPGAADRRRRRVGQEAARRRRGGRDRAGAEARVEETTDAPTEPEVQPDSEREAEVEEQRNDIPGADATEEGGAVDDASDSEPSEGPGEGPSDSPAGPVADDDDQGSSVEAGSTDSPEEPAEGERGPDTEPPDSGEQAR